MRTATALAIAGGRPAVPPGSHAHWPQLTAADRAALARVLDRGQQVPAIRPGFERRIASLPKEEIAAVNVARLGVST